MNVRITTKFPAILFGVTQVVQGAFEQVGLAEYERGLAEGKANLTSSVYQQEAYNKGYQAGTENEGKVWRLNLQRRVEDGVRDYIIKQRGRDTGAALTAIEGQKNPYQHDSPRYVAYERARREFMKAVQG